MKRRIVKIICFALCLLLLCACGQVEETPVELPELPKDMHNVPEAYALGELNLGRIWFAGAHIELFNMLNPDTYVYYQSPISSGGGREVRISGPGCEEFVNSEFADDYYKYKYKTEYFDLRRDDPIPRKPETEVSFEDGVTMRVLHSRYPARSEYTKSITYTLEADERTEYEAGCCLYKHVEGEWLSIVAESYVGFTSRYIEEGMTMYFTMRATEYLGEGLYRVEHDGKYYAEFVVRKGGKKPNVTEYDFQNCYRANVFCKVGLPLNCRISAKGMVAWPYLDRSYTKVMDGYVEAGKLEWWISELSKVPENAASLSNRVKLNDDLKKTISPYEAAEIVLPELKKLEGELLITNVEYTFMLHDKAENTVCPVWRFTVEQGEETLYFIVESRTGELLN